MKVLVSGSSGLVGSALIPFLRGQGHEVIRLIRDPGRAASDAIVWNPESHSIEPHEFEGFDAVINLAGESIVSSRWTSEKKRRIWDSRVITTKALSDCLQQLKKPPQVFISASAIGIYGDRGDEILSESSHLGKGFLAEVCRAWEGASRGASFSNVRVVDLRLGTILSTSGGALRKMLLPFKMGFGGTIGSGKQYISWVDIDDVVRSILFLIQSPTLQGPVNVVSPEPVTNKKFTKSLGKILNRPAIMGMPAFLARLIFGEVADAVLLASARVIPRKLLDAGYSFHFASLESSLKAHLKD